MDDIDRLRFYLRDPSSASQFFTENELEELLAATDTFEEAVGLGWLVKASGAATSTQTAGAVKAKTIGKVRTDYATSDESSAAGAFALSRYWFSRAGVNVARWYELQPADGFIAESIDIARAIQADGDYDLSRLLT